MEQQTTQYLSVSTIDGLVSWARQRSDDELRSYIEAKHALLDTVSLDDEI